jgi:hypothetical protein
LAVCNIYFMGKNQNHSQLSLLDLLKDLRPKTGDSASFNIDLQLREAISRAIKDCPHSRYHVAAKMSELLGIEITKSMLDSWTADSKEGIYRFPACYLPAFCKALGNIEPLRIMADLLGVYVIEGEDALLTQLGKIRDQKEQLLEKERAIKTVLQGMRK